MSISTFRARPQPRPDPRTSFCGRRGRERVIHKLRSTWAVSSEAEDQDQKEAARSSDGANRAGPPPLCSASESRLSGSMTPADFIGFGVSGRKDFGLLGFGRRNRIRHNRRRFVGLTRHALVGLRVAHRIPLWIVEVGVSLADAGQTGSGQERSVQRSADCPRSGSDRDPGVSGGLAWRTRATWYRTTRGVAL